MIGLRLVAHAKQNHALFHTMSLYVHLSRLLKSVLEIKVYLLLLFPQGQMSVQCLSWHW